MSIKHSKKRLVALAAISVCMGIINEVKAQTLPKPVTVVRDDFDNEGTDANLRREWRVVKSGGVTITTGGTEKGLVISTVPDSGGPGIASVIGTKYFSVTDSAVLQFTARMSTYVEASSIYGNRQPRGLMANNGRVNAIEFVNSIPENQVWCRTVKDGVATTTNVNVGHTVNASTMYQIIASATSVDFFIDGVKVATHTTNIPTVPLAPFLSTSDGGAMNVPILVDWVEYQRVVL